MGRPGTRLEDPLDEIERWLVTRVPETIDDADVFMPVQFLDDFELTESQELSDGLVVETFDRLSDR